MRKFGRKLGVFRCTAAVGAVGVLALGLTVGISAPAQAETADMGVGPAGWYAGAETGASFANSSKTNDGNLFSTQSFDPGAVMGAFGGYDWGMVRTEAEFSWRHGDYSKMNIANDGGIPAAAGAASLSGSRVGAEGGTEVYATMLNGLFDVPAWSRVRPYIGGGAGWAHVDTGKLKGGGINFSDSSDDVFAYQAIAGLAFPLEKRLTLTLDYRYFATEKARFKDVLGNGFESDFASHNVLIGLRYSFGAPAPAPAPAPVAAAPIAVPSPAVAVPAPTPAPQPLEYMVFFDWDKAEITPESQRILDQAMVAARAGEIPRVRMIGHADRSGPRPYNQKLSERRAKAVRDVFVKGGFDPNTIVMLGKGEGEPLVPTPDGVREPRNRRVEIFFEK